MKQVMRGLLSLCLIFNYACRETTETESVDPDAPKLVAGPLKNNLDNSELIETVQMDWEKITYKGETINVERPIVFFADGMASMDSSFLARRVSRAQFQAESPLSFRAWRRNTVGDIEMKNSLGAFAAMASSKIYRPQPRGEFLSSHYYPKFAEKAGESTQRSLELLYDGTFRDGLGREGNYSIEGYLLTLRTKDGEEQVMTLIMDPEEPRDIWLNNEPYHADSVILYVGE